MVILRVCENCKIYLKLKKKKTKFYKQRKGVSNLTLTMIFGELVFILFANVSLRLQNEHWYYISIPNMHKMLNPS